MVEPPPIRPALAISRGPVEIQRIRACLGKDQYGAVAIGEIGVACQIVSWSRFLRSLDAGNVATGSPPAASGRVPLWAVGWVALV